MLGEIESAMSSPVLEDTSNDAIHRIAGILDVNALDIYVNDDITLSGLYPTFSLLEHSCFPNTYYFFDLQQNDSKKKFKITLKAAGNYITELKLTIYSISIHQISRLFINNY